MKRQFNIRISNECFEQLETLTKRSSTNICPTCGSETEIEFSKYKGMGKAEVIGGVANAIAKNEKMVNPVVLNSLSLDDAKKVYFRK